MRDNFRDEPDPGWSEPDPGVVVVYALMACIVLLAALAFWWFA